MFNPNMLKKINKMKDSMMKAQQELEESVFVGTAGGVVSIEVKGNRAVLSVKIKPEAVDPEDVNLLEDMILAAMNDAMRQIEDTTQEVMAPYTSSMGGLF